MRLMMTIMAFLTALASLFGCGKNDPVILDGPGMVYVDSEYRNEYANCLPFADWRGEPYLAVAYLGNGDTGKANKDVYVNKIFEGLDEEKISRVKTYEYEGNDWFLVIPKYYDTVIIKKGDEEAYTEDGVPFIVRCNSDVLINVFNVTDMNFLLAVDEEGKLMGTEHDIWKAEDYTLWGQDNFVWDITHFGSKENNN